ncbi:hypothetical protein HGRIS_006385 [Hohenbuehelia grisea]|uniref:Uncharacterized protein n=1 Tax=Hohenbuehelia grisea TaxID=104357 RepID=A0ABR3K1H7_9AGAR
MSLPTFWEAPTHSSIPRNMLGFLLSFEFPKMAKVYPLAHTLTDLALETISPVSTELLKRSSSVVYLTLSVPNLALCNERPLLLVSLPPLPSAVLAFSFRVLITPTTVRRWFDRSGPREDGLTQTEWNTLLARQKEDKAREKAELALQAEQAEREMLDEWQEASTRFPVNDEGQATPLRGRSLKVIVKVWL